MIKKLIGIFVAVAVVIIIVITAIRRDNFQSMVLQDKIEDQSFPTPVTTSESTAPAADQIEVTDSVSVEITDSL